MDGRICFKPERCYDVLHILVKYVQRSPGRSAATVSIG
jgi:hypothetical protein